MVGPASLGNGPAATLNQQADSKFFSKNQKVVERILSQKVSYDKMLENITPRIPLGKIDNTFKMGDWDVHIEGDTAGNAALISKCQLSHDFSFGNKTVSMITTWGPYAMSLFGTMDDSSSIKMNVTVSEESGKLTIKGVAVDPLCLMRTANLRDGEAPEVYLNNGQKDTTLTGIVVRFSNVVKNGDNISLTVTLDMDFTPGVVVDAVDPLKVWNNASGSALLNIWFSVEASPDAKPQNYLELSVQDTVKFMLATGNGHGYDYKEAQAVQALNVNAVEGYKYPGRTNPYFNWAKNMTGTTTSVLKGGLYTLGMQDSSETWVTGKTYGRPAVAGVVPDSINGSPVFIRNVDAWGPMILMGDLTKNKSPPEYTPAANWFIPSMINNTRKENFTLRFARNWTLNDKTPLKDGEGVIGFRFEKATSDGQYFLKDGKMDYGDIVNMQLVTTGYGTDTVYTNNQRVRVIDNRHIVIEDITPESMKGDKFFVPQASLTPYAKNSDTTHTDVIEPIAQTSSIRVYPNPSDGILNVEVNGGGKQTFVNLVDMRGHVVMNLFNEVLEQGEKDTFQLNTSEFSSGIYFLQVRGTSKNEAIEVEIIH